MRPVRIAGVILSAIFAVHAAQVHAADPSLYQSHFEAIGAGEPCYARAYTAGHLDAHPEQRVAKIILGMDKANPDGVAINEDNLVLGFGVQVKTSPEWYTNSAICKSAGAEIDCFVEGDGGRFTLTAADGGALKLTSGSYGLALEGGSDHIELPSDAGDDRIFFILAPADRQVCAEATESSDAGVR